MAKVSTNITIDADVKKQAQELFADLGLDLSTAINIFLRQAVRENGLPFEMRVAKPNAETIAAIEEGRAMAHDPNAKSYANAEELKKALGL